MAHDISDSPVWLITGCSSGFGREFVSAALARGFRVVATARDPSQLDAHTGYDDRLCKLALDVTDPLQVHNVVETALKTFGRIDVLVNNAGYGLGEVEAWRPTSVSADFPAASA
jgi:NAD(P)-dependent dehydrogenase (short-subunit alcohol dehydrogenase family)